jgi:hypothetical protein
MKEVPVSYTNQCGQIENYMVRPVHEPRQPVQEYEDVIRQAREWAEGAFDLLTNENAGFYQAYEVMTKEEDKRLKHLLAEWLEAQILDRG